MASNFARKASIESKIRGLEADTALYQKNVSDVNNKGGSSQDLNIAIQEFKATQRKNDAEIARLKQELGKIEGNDSVTAGIEKVQANQQLTNNLSSKAQKGIRDVASEQKKIEELNAQSATHKELQQANKKASQLKNKLKNKKDQLRKNPVIKALENPQSVIDAQEEKIKTFKFPEDYSADLCFRLDFLKFNRQSVFETIKVTPQATFVLPLPKAIGTGMGVSYNETELGFVGAIENAIRTTDSQAFTGGIGEIAGNVIGELGKIGGDALYRGLLNTTAGKAASLAVGFIPNPHLSAIFSGVQRRTFNFQVTMAPRTEKESKQLHTMLDHLRQYILPAMSANRATLDYPHEVAISFSEAGSTLVTSGPNSYKTPLDKIFKFKRCVCSNIDVQVNGISGQQAFFIDGSPVEVTVTFQFSEVQIQTANDWGSQPTGTAAKEFADRVGTTVNDAMSGLKDSVFKRLGEGGE